MEIFGDSHKVTIIFVHDQKKGFYWNSGDNFVSTLKIKEGQVKIGDRELHGVETKAIGGFW